MVLQTNQTGRIGKIQLDNPEKLNAITPEMKSELREALHEFDGDTVAIVLESAGDRAFCSGADLDYVADLEYHDFVEFQKDSRRTFDMIDEHSAIVIAAVDGLAYGGGFEFALASDLIVSTEDTSFAVPEIDLGLIAGGGGTQRLLRKIGPNRALEMIVTGEPMDANEAYKLGLVNRVIEPSKDATAVATDLASIIAEKPPLAVKAGKQLISEGRQMSLGAALSLEQEISFTLYNTEDCQEAIQAFVEDREPERYVGR